MSEIPLYPYECDHEYPEDSCPHCTVEHLQAAVVQLEQELTFERERLEDVFKAAGDYIAKNTSGLLYTNNAMYVPVEDYNRANQIAGLTVGVYALLKNEFKRTQHLQDELTKKTTELRLREVPNGV